MLTCLKPEEVKLRASKVSSLLGIDIPAPEIEDILTRWGLKLSKVNEDE